MRHLIDPMDLSVEDIDRLLDRADDIAKNPEKYQEVCKHRIQRMLSSRWLFILPGLEHSR